MPKELTASEIAKALGHGREHRVPANGSRNAWMTCCPAHDDHTPSLKVADGDRTTVLYCYAGCDQQAVLEALYKIHDIVPARFDKDDAAPRKPGHKSIPRPPEDPPVVTEHWTGHGGPTPPGAEVPVLSGYHETDRWAWRAADGETILWNIRFDHNRNWGDKTFLQMSYWNVDGVDRWIPKSVPGRPLYDLPLDKPGLDVLMVEGEKCVKAARHYFGDLYWITTSGSSTSANSTDLTPLKGRNLIILADTDGPGLRYAASLASAANARAATLLRLPRSFAPNVGDDIADVYDHQIPPAAFHRELAAHIAELAFRL